MTEKLYYIGTKATGFTAKVVNCEAVKDGYLIELDRTAFFPEEGGQGSDSGSINGIPVKHVSIKKEIIYHLLPCPLEIGTNVTGEVDYVQRFDYMQQHSGEHILSGLAHSMYACNNVGFHLGPNETTLDLDKALSLEELELLEAKANEAILNNIPIKCSFPEPDELKSLNYRSKLDLTENVRIVEIPGIDICACCAPHVDSTGQICMIKIVKREAWKGGVRLTVLCGKRALNNYMESLSILDSLTKLCSAAPALIPDYVSKLKEDLAVAKSKLNQSEAELLAVKLETARPSDPSAPFLFFTDAADSRTVRNTVNSMIVGRSGICGIFTGNDEKGYNFILARSTGGCKELMQGLRSELLAKCGGDDKMLQGNLQVSEESVRNYLAK